MIKPNILWALAYRSLGTPLILLFLMGLMNSRDNLTVRDDKGRFPFRQNRPVGNSGNIPGQMERLSMWAIEPRLQCHCSGEKKFQWKCMLQHCRYFATISTKNWIKLCPKVKITLTSDFDEVKRVQNYFASTDAIAIFNVTIRNEKKNCDCP